MAIHMESYRNTPLDLIGIEIEESVNQFNDLVAEWRDTEPGVNEDIDAIDRLADKLESKLAEAVTQIHVFKRRYVGPR